MLYMLNQDSELKFGDAVLQYRKRINRSYELYLFNLMLLEQVAAFAERDAARRKKKLLPDEKDQAFTPKLATNPVTRSFRDNEKLQQRYQTLEFSDKVDPDSIRKLYTEFLKEESYQNYLSDTSTDVKEDREIFLALYKFCLNGELFEGILQDHYINWIDDQSLVIGAVKKTIKALPSPFDAFYEDHLPTEETTREFGEELLRKVYHNDGELLHLIEPVLKNWDVDRVAIIDMILLKMALCELTDFSTIPTKVTLNEFVEISILYSTDMSKDFINGILDRLLKQLHEDGKIQKKGRGLKG